VIDRGRREAEMDEQDTSRATAPAHDPGTPKGEEIAKKEGPEPGRDEGETTDTGRATGTSTPRFYTGVHPDDKGPIDPDSPTLTTP